MSAHGSQEYTKCVCGLVFNIRRQYERHIRTCEETPEMRTKWRGLRMAQDFLASVDPEKRPLEYAKRREALQALNFVLKVRTVLDGCNAGHEQFYIDKIATWEDTSP